MHTYTHTYKFTWTTAHMPTYPGARGSPVFTETVPIPILSSLARSSCLSDFKTPDCFMSMKYLSDQKLRHVHYLIVFFFGEALRTPVPYSVIAAPWNLDLPCFADPLVIANFCLNFLGNGALTMFLLEKLSTWKKVTVFCSCVLSAIRD